MHKISHNHRAAARHLLPVLNRVFSRPRRTAAFLSTYVAAYVIFHWKRRGLPHGHFRDSFPSFLVLPFKFSIVDLVPGIRFHTRRNKFVILTCTAIVAAIWFEIIVPTFYSKSTGDIGDAVAMFFGLFFYFGQHLITECQCQIMSEPHVTAHLCNSNTASRIVTSENHERDIFQSPS